jgi:hypothetical protein
MRSQRIVRTAPVAASFGMLALRMRGHDVLLYVRRTGSRPSQIAVAKSVHYTDPGA